ncbi:hypothetical protein ACF1B0_05865 [Streptomyces anandii]|uniref:hypothetical protein n=1 Tax=Streptomyces anandii TaxID=285454 RepID=UPI003701E47F
MASREAPGGFLADRRWMTRVLDQTYAGVNGPADPLYVAPLTRPLPDDSTARDEEHLDRTGLLGSYRRHIGWGRGRTPSALRAVGPPLGPPRSKGPTLPITS